MKAKTLVAMAALALLIGVPARGAEVISSNIVGYNKVTLDAGFNLVGSQFLRVGGTVQDIQDFTTPSSNMAGLDENGMFQTELRVWNGNGYDYYGWLNATDGTDNEVPEWNSSWLLYDMSDIATENMTLGDGYWIKTSQGGTAVFAGEVSSATTTNKNLVAGFNLLCNPFPEPLSIQNINSDNLPGLDGEGMFQTELRVWNGNGYDYYGWLNATDGTDNEVPEWNSSWILFDMSDIATATIKVGEGFWIKTPSNASVTFTK